MTGPYITCDKCGGTGFRQLAGPLHVRCRACKGTGQRPRLAWRIWTMLRHGAASREDY